MNKHPFSSLIFPLNQWLSISNLLTLSRIALTPFIICRIIRQDWIAVFVLFFCAALTDVLDGFCARILHEPTDLGALLDPLADKFLLISCFIALAAVHVPTLGLPLWFVVSMIVREVLLIAGSIIIICISPGVRLRATWWGKVTTFCQIVLVFWLTTCYFFDWVPVRTYHSVLGGITILAIISCIHYLRMGFAKVRFKRI